MDNTKTTIIWGLIGTLLLAGIIFVSLQKQEPQIRKDKDRVILVLDYGNGKIRRFQGSAEHNMRAWDLLQQAVVSSSVSIETRNSFVPKSIDGLPNGKDGKQWHLYVNGVRQEGSPFEIFVQGGDEVSFRFE